MKERDRLRTRLRVVDFAAAFIGASHSWLMFTESYLYSLPFEETNNLLNTRKHYSDGAACIALRILGLLLSMLLVYLIYQRYTCLYLLRKIDNHDRYYKTLWRDPGIRGPFVLETLLCSLFLPLGADAIIVSPYDPGVVSYPLDMIFA